MMADRPEKFHPDEVYYDKAEGPEKCSGCIHLFTRKLDGYRVCEIVRPEPEESIRLDYKCQFQTEDGEDFPLMVPNR